MSDDVFGTAALRHAVTESWLGSATRFREDANAEEDHARGHYRDRVVVELLQNAADAAARAGAPGRVLITLDPGARVLRVANDGAPLDADGVASLASLRASAKSAHPGVVGRFGVGFAAVRAVSDEVVVASRDGGVRFGLDGTRRVLREATSRADLPDAPLPVRRLAADVAARGDDLPVLRLPFPAPALVDDRHVTAVEVLLRDDAALAAVRAQLDDVDECCCSRSAASTSSPWTPVPGTRCVRCADRSAGPRGRGPGRSPRTRSRTCRASTAVPTGP